MTDPVRRTSDTDEWDVRCSETGEIETVRRLGDGSLLSSCDPMGWDMMDDHFCEGTHTRVTYQPLSGSKETE